MLDTIIFKLKDLNTEQIDKVYNSLKHLNWDTNYSEKKGITSNNNSVNLKNLIISINSYNTITISGSLSTYYYGNNFKTLNFNDLNKSISNLESEIGLSLDEAKLSKLHITSVIPTMFKASTYYNSLISYPHKQRNPLGTGLYFKSTSESICLYDKSIQAKINDGNSYLRFEHRLDTLAKVKKVLKIERVVDLKSEEVYNRLIQFLYKSYTYIQKERKSYNDAEVDSVIKVSHFFRSLGIQKVGGIAAALDKVKEFQMKGQLDNKEADNARRSIKRFHIDVSEVNNPLIVELDKAVKDELSSLLTSQYRLYTKEII